MVLAFTLLSFEIAARVYLSTLDPSESRRYATRRDLLEAADSRDSRFQRHHYLGHIPRPGLSVGLNKHNSLGFRGEEIPMPKPEHEFRIVCLGGSTTYTSAVEDYRLSYPDQLQDFLAEMGYSDMRVINAGVSDWTTYESLINLALRVVDLDPDLLVVYHGMNDAEARLVWPGEALAPDNSSARRPEPLGTDHRFLVDDSALVRVLAIRLGLVEPLRPLGTLYSTPPELVGDDLVLQTYEGSYPRGLLAEIDLGEILRSTDTAFFSRNLEHMIAIARFRNIATVLLTFKHSPLEDTKLFYSAEEFGVLIEEMNRAIIEVSKKHGVSLFDFANDFPSGEEWFADGVHVNEAGARLKAERIGDFLIRNELLPAASRD
jgi:lysophospholipase L1-like esterase